MALIQTVAWPDRYAIEAEIDEGYAEIAVLACLSCNWTVPITGRRLDHVIHEIHEHNRVHGR